MRLMLMMRAVTPATNRNEAADAATRKIREAADADDARLGLLQLGNPGS